MRYFRSDSVLSQQLRQQVMFLLGQPNGMAAEPWPIEGDFTADGWTYIALGPHHTDGHFWESIISEALLAGVEEITGEQYMQARGSSGGLG